MPRPDLRAATRAAMEAGVLGKAGGTKVFFPALVFLIGPLLIGAETPSAAVSSAGTGSWTAVFRTNASLLTLPAVVLTLFEA